MIQTQLSEKELKAKVVEIGPFYHNIKLPFGIETAPEQDSPARGANYSTILSCLPDDLTGMTVLDLGCNAGAFSIEAKRRGAKQVVGIDYSEKYIQQAKFCASVLGFDIDYQRGDACTYLKTSPKFDYVIFVGLLYHLHDPLGVARLVRAVTKRACILETVGVSPKFRDFKEGLMQLPRPEITHSGTIWINQEGLRFIFIDFAKFKEAKFLFDGARIGALLTV